VLKTNVDTDLWMPRNQKTGVQEISAGNKKLFNDGEVATGVKTTGAKHNPRFTCWIQHAPMGTIRVQFGDWQALRREPDSTEIIRC